MTDIDDLVAARVQRQLEAAKARDAAKRRRRRELERNRAYGLAARRRQRLRNLDERTTP
jgi:hypothetical protein